MLNSKKNNLTNQKVVGINLRGSSSYWVDGFCLFQGFYMLKRNSSTITSEYLFKVMTNKVFRFKHSYVKVGQQLEKSSSQQLWEQLQVIYTEKPWGFDKDYLTDKIWITNVFYKLSILSQDYLRIIYSLNTSFHRSSQGRFFKRFQEQSKAYKKTTEITKQVKKKLQIKKRKNRQNNQHFRLNDWDYINNQLRNFKNKKYILSANHIKYRNLKGNKNEIFEINGQEQK